MNYRSHLLLLLGIACIFPGCGQRTTKKVLSKSHTLYDTVAYEYHQEIRALREHTRAKHLQEAIDEQVLIAHNKAKRAGAEGTLPPFMWYKNTIENTLESLYDYKEQLLTKYSITTRGMIISLEQLIEDLERINAHIVASSYYQEEIKRGPHRASFFQDEEITEQTNPPYQTQRNHE